MRLVTVLVCGRMVVWSLALLREFRLPVLVPIFLPLSWLCRVLFGEVEEYGFARLDRRADFREDILALQAFWLGHLGIDNLDVVRSIGRLLDHGSLSRPLPLVEDGDLIHDSCHGPRDSPYH